MAQACFALPLPEQAGQFLPLRVALIRDLRRQVPCSQPEEETEPDGGSSSHLGNVELIALTGSLFHAQTNGLFHTIEELLPKWDTGGELSALAPLHPAGAIMQIDKLLWTCYWVCRGR